MKQTVPIRFFACSYQDAETETHRQRACDTWIYDWLDTDFYWLFGNDNSPLARGYYIKIHSEINNAIYQAIEQCENRRYVSQPTPETGVRLNIVSRLNKSKTAQNGNKDKSIAARFSVPFSPSTTQPNVCPPIARELFTKPVDFDYTLLGAVGDNFRWELRDQQTYTPDPYFDLYQRTLKFTGSNNAVWLGDLHLVIAKLIDLRVQFETRPIPASAAARVDQNQPLHYQVSTGGGFFNIAAVIEVQHIESGQRVSLSIHGGSHSPLYLPTFGDWPDAWKTMAMDADGDIHHDNLDLQYSVSTLDPASIGLPTTGTYRMRYILLGYGYRTENRYVSSSILGGNDRMSSKPIFLTHMPTLMTYTPGFTDGLITPFEISYTRSPILANGIEFDAVFDFKNLTAFRFVVKVTNHHDFALGVIVQAAGWQAWVHLPAGETKYLAGAVSVSGMSNSYAYPLHPQSPSHGWNGNWSNASVSMNNGLCSVLFGLFLTAPTQPETMPANLPTKKAALRWQWNVADLLPQYAPRWAAIKRYASNGQYDWDNILMSTTLKTISRAISQPAYQTLLDPASFFVTGYNTATDNSSPWHKSPWPSAASVPIMCSGEQKTVDGTQTVWVPNSEIALMLTRPMLQQVAALLGINEYVVMDGDDLRWCQISPTNTWHNVLWIDRFYTQSGTTIDAVAMRNAFQLVIDNNVTSWPDYRNLVVHPSVRFGIFLDNGGFEVGDYLLGQNCEMVEVPSFADLGSLSARFLYHIKPDNQ